MFRRWDKSRMPLGPWTLNKDAPQAQGLVAWFPLAGAGGVWAPDYAGSNHMTMGTAPTPTLDRHGAPSLSFVAASSQYLEAVQTAVTDVPFTMACWAKITGTTDRVPMSLSRNGFNARAQLQVTPTRALNVSCVDGAGVSATAVTSTTAVNGEWSHLAGVCASNSSRISYINGAGGVANTTIINTPSLDRMLLGARRNSSGVGIFLDYPLGETGFWNIALEQAMVQRLCDPGLRFELWYPLRSKKWISVGGGTNTQVNPGVGALALSGQIPSITQSANQSVDPAVGSVALTGWAPGVAQPIAVSPGVGSLTLSGWAPGIVQQAGQEVFPDAGTLTLTGPVPTIAQSANRTADPDTGTLTLSGPAPTVTQSANVDLQPGVGTLTLTGGVPFVQQAPILVGGSRRRPLMGTGL